MTLDPQLAAVLHNDPASPSFSSLLPDVAALDELGRFTITMDSYELPVVPTELFEATGPHGPVPIRMYGQADASSPKPALVWLHGGGFVSGGLSMPEADQLARELVSATGAVVFSVGYRLARNGVHFPVPHDDTIAAWLWVTDHSRELGVDPSRVALGGASAGGNLAAGAALSLMDAGLVLPRKLILAYPFVHEELPSGLADSADEDVLKTLPRILQFTPDDCRRMVENYIGGPASMASSYAMPGHAYLAGLPPTAILTCQYDALRVSAEQFAADLRNAGVDVTLRVEPGATHGFLSLSAGFDIVRRGLEFLGKQLTDRDEPLNS